MSEQSELMCSTISRYHDQDDPICHIPSQSTRSYELVISIINREDNMFPGIARARWLINTTIPHIFVLDCADDDDQVRLQPPISHSSLFHFLDF